jgi:hypothetical protein
MSGSESRSNSYRYCRWTPNYNCLGVLTPCVRDGANAATLTGDPQYVDADAVVPCEEAR